MCDVTDFVVKLSVAMLTLNTQLDITKCPYASSPTPTRNTVILTFNILTFKFWLLRADAMSYSSNNNRLLNFCFRIASSDWFYIRLVLKVETLQTYLVSIASYVAVKPPQLPTISFRMLCWRRTTVLCGCLSVA